MSDDLRIWIIIASLTLITVVTRSLFLMAGSTITIPPSVQRALRFAPAATLVALVLPSLVTLNQELTLDSINPVTNPKLAAGIVAGLVFLYTRHMLLMIAVGMMLFSLLRLYAT